MTDAMAYVLEIIGGGSALFGSFQLFLSIFKYREKSVTMLARTLSFFLSVHDTAC